MHHQYTLDDVEALQVALKQEQVARALAESDLHIARMQARAAEDDAEANHLALTVVQQVAAQMATDSGGTRRWSTGGPLSQAYNPSTVSGNDTVPVSPTDQVVDAGVWAVTRSMCMLVEYSQWWFLGLVLECVFSAFGAW